MCLHLLTFAEGQQLGPTNYSNGTGFYQSLRFLKTALVFPHREIAFDIN
jgi:hypothetical protein